MKKDQNIETLLGLVEDSMQNVLTKKIKEASKEQAERTSMRKEWVLETMCQVASVSSMIYWTEKTEEAIYEMDSDPFSL